MDNTLYVWVVSAVFTAIAAYTDARTGKIRNWLVAVMLAAGFGYHLWTHTFAFAAQGFGYGLATVILYLCGVFGEGDVKLTVALGSLVGPAGVLFVLTAAYLLVLLYWLWLIIKGNPRENLKREWRLFYLYGVSLLYLVGGFRFAKIRDTMEQIKAAQAGSPTVPYGVFFWLGVLTALATVIYAKGSG